MTPRRANTPTLTREQIVAAAIAIVDREGIDALSMRKLAAELGVGTMTLYHHVPDKSALYDLILEAVYGAAALPADNPAAPVEERLVSMSYGIRDALLAHPNVAPIAISRSLRTPDQMRVIESMLGLLYDVGIEPSEAISAINVIGQYVVGLSVIYSHHLDPNSRYHDPVNESDYSALPAEQFPNTHRALAEAAPHSWDQQFDAGLRALIRGLVTDSAKPQK